jgi:hypothetical protein
MPIHSPFCMLMGTQLTGTVTRHTREEANIEVKKIIDLLHKVKTKDGLIEIAPGWFVRPSAVVSVHASDSPYVGFYEKKGETDG